jgi:hypothetical protein
MSLEQSLESKFLQNEIIHGNRGSDRIPQILDRTQEVAGSSPASSTPGQD